MTKTLTDLPGWTFEIEELTAGIYQVGGTDQSGQNCEMKGTAVDALLAACKEFAAKPGDEINYRD